MVTVRIILLLGMGTAGALLARRYNLPGGSLLGAMLAAGAFSLLGADSQQLPEGVRSVALVLLGIYTGSSMDYRRLVEIRRVLPATLASILVLIAAGCGLGWLLHRHYPHYLSPVTALLGTMPGGASGLTAMAYDLGAEVQLVASIHMVRLIIVFGLLPLVLARFVRPAKSPPYRRTESLAAGDEGSSKVRCTDPD